MTALFLLLISICILSLIVGHLPECIKLPCWLDFKPFNCQLCLTTWCCAILQTLVACITGLWLYFIAGIVASIIIFVLIRLDERNKWE